MNLPERIDSEAVLDEILTHPSDALIKAVKGLTSPLMVLGASGKMGPTLCVLAKRAAATAGHPLRVIAVSRFSDPLARSWLEQQGIETIPCDLLDRHSLDKLPGAANVVHLVGLKFGTGNNPSLTWAVNALVPSRVAERYPSARMVALSTGNVYPLVRTASGGATEDDPAAPVGEYGFAALARERIFEYYAQAQGTPVTLLRLNYAVELRYGVLRDIGEQVWNGAPIDLTNGYLNCIWQGDANEMVLRSFPLAASPASIYNLTGPAVLSVRELAGQFATLMDRPAHFIGQESDTALLNNAARLCRKFGQPSTPLDRMIQWTAAWIAQGGRTLGKATHFEVRTGAY